MKTIGEIMQTHIITADKTNTISAVTKIMAENVISCVIITDKGKPAGMLTERDVIKKVVSAGKDPKKIKAANIMTSPLFSVSPDTTFGRALEIIREKRMRRLVITENNRLLGVVTQTDIVERTQTLHEDNTKLSLHQNIQSYIIIVSLIFFLIVLGYTFFVKIL